mmetsp:Transcript_6228/g.16059  ORF Transcript_6228/g.16059 Transcript_6228/m.16059 type:complete len:224 (+) Transcript_6228:1672-2343(+)
MSLSCLARSSSTWCAMRRRSSHDMLISFISRSDSASFSRSSSIWASEMVAVPCIPPAASTCRRCSTSSRSSRIILALASSLTTANVWIRLAVSAYRSVESDSSTESSEGEIVAIITVFELPPRFSFNSHVSTESRYGMNESFTFLPTAMSARFEMTRPSVERDLLIDPPSRSRSPSAPVRHTRSDPARSTSEIRDVFSPVLPVIVSNVDAVSVMLNTACDRDD